MLQDRLNYFESERLLNFERDTDVLTTLANRRSMYDQMKQIESGKAEIPSGVLMIDIDHFKIFNDTYGHEAGDKCLHSFGSFLKSKSSESILFYRFGGEEFVAFLYDFTKENIADFAILLCKETSDLDTGVGKMTISIGGVYCYDKTKNNLEYWIDLADQASYEAKHKGRNTVVMSDSYIQSLKLDINEWESE